MSFEPLNSKKISNDIVNIESISVNYSNDSVNQNMNNTSNTNSTNNNTNNGNDGIDGKNIDLNYSTEDKKYLIIVVDMDDDVGRKANISSPILGRNENISAAVKLGLADPGDSDVNSILGGVKHYDSLKRENRDVELATITGAKDVNSEECAIRIKEQLDFLIYLYEPDFIYIVSDGKEDETILKYLELKDIFVWKKRIVIKQNESLESTYYLIQEFINKTMSRYIPLIFVSIGFVLILYAVFQDLGWRIISGLLGIYVLSEGAGLTENIKSKIMESKEGLQVGKISPAGGIISLLIIIVGGIYAYRVSEDPEWILFVGKFLLNIASPLTLSVAILVCVHFIDDLVHTKKNILNLLKALFFQIITVLMVRQLLIVFSTYLLGSGSFNEIIVYIVVYIAILIILSAVLFYNSKNSRKDEK
ncbi:putative membrane protein [Methanococcus voltae]|uniref:Putative membrane protein n=1 Tax=Methanococcus voltae TaxID=2188 RepID=A0A8J7S085_METVO|nr:DUF373 family protein [Methanococcus voltae]MBP2201020.1 putative membrane protein [Methanococcus voltae]